MIFLHGGTRPTCTPGILLPNNSRDHCNLLPCPGLIDLLTKTKHHWALKENFASLQQDAPSLRKIRAKNP